MASRFHTAIVKYFDAFQSILGKISFLNFGSCSFLAYSLASLEITSCLIETSSSFI